MKYLKEKYVRWVGICFVAVMVMNLDPEDHMLGEPVWKHYLVSWLFTAVFWNGAFLIFMMFRRMFPEIRQTMKRLILTYITLFIWMSVGGVPVKLALGLMSWREILSLATYTEFLAMNLIIALIVGTLYETVFFFEKWKDAIRQNEELKNQQVRTQFEVLQNQMSPHFLFNSLNTLTTLIGENQQVAMEFTERLSDVYRYILHTREREFVSLEEEVRFARDYFYLLKMRYPDNLHANFDIPQAYKYYHIAPLTLQMLLENAIKHNVISKAHPLVIELYIAEDSIYVRNNVQRKPTLEKGTKTGLTNIKRRYELLGNREIELHNDGEEFVVGVPLFKVEKEYKMVNAE